MTTAHNFDVITSRRTEEDRLDIEALVSANLPPLPGSVARILDLLQGTEFSHAELCEAINYDPILASRIMRLANPALYALQRPVSTVSSAVAAIGSRAVYDNVIVSVAADSFSSDFRSVKTGVSIWEHSVAVALAARELSRTLGLRGTEEAFTCGLLHDIGKNLLFVADEMRFSETNYAENEDTASEMEMEIFGYNHSQIGARISRRWGLSEAVSSTIRAHHEPSMAVEAKMVAHIVNVADELATLKGMGLYLEEPEILPSSASATALGLTDDQMEEAWKSVEESLRAIIAVPE